MFRLGFVTGSPIIIVREGARKFFSSQASAGNTHKLRPRLLQQYLKKKKQNFVGAKTKIISSEKETDNKSFTLITDCLLMIRE